ncbi:MAG: hypothetical protein CFE37_04385 [Alphaproteobacteria bacterium PA4]|nr:MAG: hypothetical protein CFE37_04385 [Alphaproteobacteria bacterium PA4]
MIARLLLAATLLAGSTPALAQAVGTNAAIRNQVTMKTARDAAPRPAVLREPVSLGDQIASGAASQLQVLLRDQSVFTIGANARMTIDKFVYDPARGASDVAASVARGAFRFMSGRSLGRAGGGTAAVRTPVASIGVRGTIIEGAVGEEAVAAMANEGAAGNTTPGEGATLIVLRGPGPRANGLDKPGAIDVTAGGVTVTLDRPGMALYIPGPGMAPIGPFLLSAEGYARLGEYLRTTPGNVPDSGPIGIESTAVASGEILSVAEFAGIWNYDPLAVEQPLRRTEDLGVPCDPPVNGGPGGSFCPR